MGWLLSIYAVIATFSFLVFPFVWIIGYGINGSKKLASRLAADITMIFLIGAVALLFNNLFSTSNGFWIIVLFLLLMAGFIGNAQTRLRGKINAYKIGRAVWRIGFIVLGLLYVLFSLISLIKIIIQI